ncbi:unnamed protein product [Sphagnum troendelagicum]|uniref:Uncharacterized protein n=1 Tax=Sphagnum troendelagicum TaxID=128251 RepID=A0ABP0TG85_9BRYO
MKVKCGVRGDVRPACNVVGFVDHFIFGLKHMKNHATYQHTPSCSLHSPNYGGLPPNAPNWCLAPFEHEVGQNSLLLFRMVALGMLLAFLQGMYWKSPQNNIITFLKDHVVHHYLGFTKWI